MGAKIYVVGSFRIERELEIYEIIAPQPEHVAGELDRHVFIVAEPELPNRLVVARW
jgi:hypothetical protein